MTRRRPALWMRPWALVLLVFMVVVSACGDDDDSESVSAEDKVTTTTDAEEESTTTTAAAATSTTATTAKAAPSTATTAPPATGTPAKKLSGEITVLTAASLTDAFTEIGNAFKAANPEASVKFSFDSSSTLATQANSGAPADVFASADETNMKKVTDTGTASGPRTFTRNRLAVLVQKGNPKGIGGLADFNRADVSYVICADGVPCGTYGKEALGKAGVTRAPKSLEANVKAVVTRVTLGEADAGIVYTTDAKAAAGKSDSIDIPDDLNVTASYPIASLKQSGRPEVANAFVDFVLSPTGQNILARYGFLPAT